MIQRHRATAPLVALAALGALAGCSDDAPAPPAAPVASSTAPVVAESSEPPAAPITTPTSVATTDASVPEQTELSRTFTVDGASAFAGYFTQVLNHARSTGDSGLLEAISDAGCVGCTGYVDEIHDRQQREYSNNEASLEFRGTEVVFWDAKAGEIRLNVTTNRSPHQVLDRDGRLLEDVPSATNLTSFIELKWFNDHWVVWEVER